MPCYGHCRILLALVAVLLLPSGAALAGIGESVAEAGRRCASGQAEDGLNALRDLGLLREGKAVSRADYADTVPVIADCYAAQGLHLNATQVLRAGIERAEGAQAPDVVARLREKLGRLLLQSGSALEAQRQFEIVLAAIPATDSRRPGLMLALAASHVATDRNAESPGNFYRDAMHAADEQGDLPVLVDAQLGLFRVLLADSKPETGLLTSSLKLIERLPNDPAKAPLMTSLGQLYASVDERAGSTANRKTAVDLLTRSAAMARDGRNLRTEATALGTLGRIAEQAADWDKALQYSRLAVARADQVNALDELYQWQWQVARIHEARGKDDLAAIAYQQSLATLQAVRSEVARASTLNFDTQVQPVFYDFANLLLRQDTASAGSAAETEPRLRRVTRTIEQLRQAQILNYFDNECVLNQETQTELPVISADAAIIYPIILEDRLELLVTSGGVVRRYTAKVSSRVLDQTIKSFREELESRSRTRYFEVPAAQLYDWLVRPALEDLRTRGIRILVFVPDQMLRTIPPAALFDGSKFLIEEFAVAVTPGLTVTNPEAIVRGTAEVLSTGLTEQVDPEFPALPGVAAELDRINELFSTREFRDSAFRMAPVATELAEGRYTIVHIATHGKFKANFRDSFLLTYDGRLKLDDLEQAVGRRRYLNEPVELLVLSACETAQGDSEAALGLAGIALKAGARSAVATLWNVNDIASAELIGDFYTELSDPTVSKAEALRRAQRSLLRQPELAHPGLWSPFLLIGNWL